MSEIVFSNKPGPGACIVSEANNWRSRDTMTLAPSQTVTPNSPVAKNGAGQVVKLNPASSDGTQTPIGVAIEGGTTGAGKTLKIAVLTRDAEVHAGLLDTGTANAVQITAIRNGLKALGIIPRIDVKEAIS